MADEQQATVQPLSAEELEDLASRHYYSAGGPHNARPCAKRIFCYGCSAWVTPEGCDINRLLVTLRAAEAERDEALSVLRMAEWGNDSICPQCFARWSPSGHRHCCAIGRTLSRSECQP